MPITGKAYYIKKCSGSSRRIECVFADRNTKQRKTGRRFRKVLMRSLKRAEKQTNYEQE